MISDQFLFSDSCLNVWFLSVEIGLAATHRSDVLRQYRVTALHASQILSFLKVAACWAGKTCLACLTSSLSFSHYESSRSELMDW